MNAMKPVFDALDAIIRDVEKALEAPLDTNKLSTTAPAENERPGAQKSPDQTPADKKQVKKKDKKPKQTPTASADPVVSQFLQCDLRVGRIQEVSPHPEADGLYVLKIEYSNDETRTVCAGLRKFIPEEEMQSRMVVTICNLKPRKLRGVASEAMILAGSVVSGEGEKETVVPLAPPPQAVEGTVVMADGITGERTVEGGKYVSSKVWDKVVPRLGVKNGIACYNDKPLQTVEGAVACFLPDGAEIH